MFAVIIYQHRLRCQLVIVLFTTELLSDVWLCLQEASEASYVATMKTVRQVKTVFIIFIAFVCCWSPYVFVLLYDSSDNLPLSVHLYTSMLAHLHASLNFAIYSLNNRNCGENCLQLFERLVACCCRQMSRNNATVAAAAVEDHNNRDAGRTNRGRGVVNRRIHNMRNELIRGIDDVSRTLVTADVECYQLQEMQG